jgi:hypothetical protein
LNPAAWWPPPAGQRPLSGRPSKNIVMHLTQNRQSRCAVAVPATSCGRKKLNPAAWWPPPAAQWPLSGRPSKNIATHLTQNRQSCCSGIFVHPFEEVGYAPTALANPLRFPQAYCCLTSKTSILLNSAADNFSTASLDRWLRGEILQVTGLPPPFKE